MEADDIDEQHSLQFTNTTTTSINKRVVAYFNANVYVEEMFESAQAVIVATLLNISINNRIQRYVVYAIIMA